MGVSQLLDDHANAGQSAASRPVTPSLVSLPYSITLYVPSDGLTVDRGTVIEYWSRRLAAIFGGVTSVNATGHWVNGAGVLVTEPVTLLTSYLSDADYGDAGTIAAQFARYLLDRGQESALVAIDGKAILTSK